MITTVYLVEGLKWKEKLFSQILQKGQNYFPIQPIQLYQINLYEHHYARQISQNL